MTVKKMLVVLAHPDDESFSIGGTLARSVAEDKYVHLVVATRGEAGIPDKDAVETALIPEEELRAACAELGIQELTFLGFKDGRLADIDKDQAIARIRSIMRQFWPDVVITFGRTVFHALWHVWLANCRAVHAQRPDRYYKMHCNFTDTNAGPASPAFALGSRL